ncbi:hypothetical protein [Rhizobium sp. 21-4511-3d]
MPAPLFPLAADQAWPADRQGLKPDLLDVPFDLAFRPRVEVDGCRRSAHGGHERIGFDTGVKCGLAESNRQFVVDVAKRLLRAGFGLRGAESAQDRVRLVGDGALNKLLKTRCNGIQQPVAGRERRPCRRNDL